MTCLAGFRKADLVFRAPDEKPAARFDLVVVSSA
jgi:hypothetical protein